jgi:hypothetical protein
MRKLLMVTIVGLVPAFGCTDCLETMRRIEVWKAQTFFTPSQPPVLTPAACAPCGAPAAAAPGCNCQQGAAAPTAMTTSPGETGETVVPGSVTVGYPADSAETVSTEELDGVLKQP